MMILQDRVQRLTADETKALIAKLDTILPELSPKEEDVVRQALTHEGLAVPPRIPVEDVAWWAGDVGY